MSLADLASCKMGGKIAEDSKLPRRVPTNDGLASTGWLSRQHRTNLDTNRSSGEVAMALKNMKLV